MNKMEEIRSTLIIKTNFLLELGYNKIVEKNDVWNYTLSYLSFEKGLAIEFEVDYRDLDIFVLVTKLENNNLPKGYYMNEGKNVRIHLEKLFENKKNKSGDWEKVMKLRYELKGQNELRILTLIEAYSTLLIEAENEIQKLFMSVL